MTPAQAIAALLAARDALIDDIEAVQALRLVAEPPVTDQLDDQAAELNDLLAQVEAALQTAYIARDKEERG